MKKVVIIGAGIGGLATAALLAARGYTVSVYEKSDASGGRAGEMKQDGFRFDTGPSWYLMPEVFAHFYALLGEDADDILKPQRVSPSYSVFFDDGSTTTITGDLDRDTATFEVIGRGSGTALRRYAETAHDIYDMSMKHFLYTNFSKPQEFLHPDIIRRSPKLLWMSAISIDRYVSRFFKSAKLRQIMEYSMVFLGSSPFRIPAIYSLMGDVDFRQGVYYPRGGMYSIIRTMKSIAKARGVVFHYNSDVKKIITSNGLAEGIELNDGKIVNADMVISNADIHHNETKMLDARDRTYGKKYWAKREAGPSALLFYLGVKGSLGKLPHHSLIFVKNWRENFRSLYEKHEIPVPASIYLSRTTATDLSAAPKGHENLVVLVPLPAGVDLSSDECESYYQQYMSQIEQICGLPDLRAQVVSKTIIGPNDFGSKFYAWQNTALGPSHVLGQSAIFRTRNRSRKVRNLYYVGAFTTPGIGLPMCLISAEQVYKQIEGIKSSGRIAPVLPKKSEEN